MMLSENLARYEPYMGTILSSVVAVVVAVLVWNHFNYSIKVDVPTIGVGVRYTKWVSAVRNIWHARESILEGYKKYGNYAFQVPTMTRMDVFICDRQMTREYSTLGNDQMSFQAVMSEEFQFQHLCPGHQEDPTSIPTTVIAKALSWQRTRASKAEDPFFQAFSLEFIHGFQKEMRALTSDNSFSLSSLFGQKGPDPSSGWHAVTCFPLALKVVARLTTFSLFGEPLCRDEDFLNMCCSFGDAIPKGAMFLRLWPGWSRGYVSKMMAAPQLLDKLGAILTKEIATRREREKNEMKDLLDFALNWCDTQPGRPYTDEHLCSMMTSTIFAALHTSSQLVVHVIFELASRPEYTGPLRDEVRRCFEEHGTGTKKAIDHMYKVDSFIKETQRVNPLDASALARLAIKDYTFSNGLRVPKGSYIFTPNAPIFTDEKFYPDPQRFDGFRFAKMRDDPVLKSSCDLTATNEQSMHFGIGRHACPGRFMVSDEVKLAVVHLLQNFDFCIENHGQRPKNMPFGKFLLPDMRAKIWLKESTVRSE